MDIALTIAQWSGKLPPGFVPPSVSRTLPTCCHKRCKRPVWIKPDGTLAKACRPCLDRRAASCRRRRRHFVELGGCRRCAYRKRLEGDYLCRSCRDHRDAAREERRRDNEDSNLDRGVSPWNARPKPQPSAAYWSPLPDPEPKSTQEWRHAISDTGWRYRRC